MGDYDGEELCKLTGLLLLSKLCSKCNKNDIVLYHDELDVLKSIYRHQKDKMRKKIPTTI